jgi:adenylate kinase
MNQNAFIFIGRSGCGKGTQIEMLVDLLKNKDPGHGILQIYTGREFRKFIQGSNTTQKLSKAIYDVGGLMPEFLAAHMWTSLLVENFNGNQHVIFDGTPRKLHEAGVLDSVFGFYGFTKPWVINIEITKEEATKRLILRKRLDDNEEDIKKRLAWYDTDVAPTVEFYRNNREYNFVCIDGERTPNEIHEDIVKKLGLV